MKYYDMMSIYGLVTGWKNKWGYEGCIYHKFTHCTRPSYTILYDLLELCLSPFLRAMVENSYIRSPFAALTEECYVKLNEHSTPKSLKNLFNNLRQYF